MLHSCTIHDEKIKKCKTNWNFINCTANLDVNLILPEWRSFNQWNEGKCFECFFLFSWYKISGSILFSAFSNLFSTQLLDKNQICYTFHEIHVTSTIIDCSPFACAFHANDDIAPFILCCIFKTFIYFIYEKRLLLPRS